MSDTVTIKNHFKRMSTNDSKSGIDKILGNWQTPQNLLEIFKFQKDEKIYKDLAVNTLLLEGSVLNPSFNSSVKIDLLTNTNNLLLQNLKIQFDLSKATSSGTVNLVPFPCFFEEIYLSINNKKTFTISGEALFSHTIANMERKDALLYDKDRYNLDGSYDISSAALSHCMVDLSKVLRPFLCNPKFMRECSINLKYNSLAKCVDVGSTSPSVDTTMTNLYCIAEELVDTSQTYIKKLTEVISSVGYKFKLDYFSDDQYDYQSSSETVTLNSNLSYIEEIYFFILDVNSLSDNARNYSTEMNEITSFRMFNQRGPQYPYTNSTQEQTSEENLNDVYLRELKNDIIAQEPVYVIPINKGGNSQIIQHLNMNNQLTNKIKFTGNVATDRLYITYKSVCEITLQKGSLFVITKPE